MGWNVGRVVVSSSRVLVLRWGVCLFVAGLSGCTRAAPKLDAAQAFCAEAKQRGGDLEANRCFEEQAIARVDSKYCDALVAVGSSESSRARCLHQVAVAAGDAKSCAGTGSASEADGCFRDLAQSLEDAGLCKQISKSELADDCVSRVALSALDIELCKQVKTERVRSTCISQIVDRDGDGQACVEIPEPRARVNCIKSAIRHGDPNLCGKLSGRDRGDCWNSTERGFADFEAACDGDADCLLAMGRENIGACAAIKDGQAYLRTQCFATAGMYGPREQDGFCEHLPRPDLRDECLDGIGRGRGHGDSCAKIKDAKRRADCVFAAGLVDPNYCRALTVASELHRCVAASNFDTADNSICQGLERTRQIDCQRATAQRLDTQLRRLH